MKPRRQKKGKVLPKWAAWKRWGRKLADWAPRPLPLGGGGISYPHYVRAFLAALPVFGFHLQGLGPPPPGTPPRPAPTTVTPGSPWQFTGQHWARAAATARPIPAEEQPALPRRRRRGPSPKARGILLWGRVLLGGELTRRPALPHPQAGFERKNQRGWWKCGAGEGDWAHPPTHPPGWGMVEPPPPSNLPHSRDWHMPVQIIVPPHF